MAPPPTSPNYHPLVRAVARGLRSRCRVPSGASIVVGCSGGADSVALLRALAILAERRRWGLRLIVGHVQHHLREDEAERDAAFVSHLAGDLGLAFERRDIRPADEQGNLEANARKLRYRALADIALKRSARFVATAHHADDQLETMLMRMMRGASTKGMRGIAWRRRLRTPDPSARAYAIRPMLATDREQALGLLALLNQPWVEDTTNLDTSRTRARVRHEVVPKIKAIQADAAGKAVALGEHFDHLHRLVREQADAASENGTLDQITRSAARKLNPVVLTQMLRRDLIAAGVKADRLPGHALHPVIEAAKDNAGGVREFTFAGGIKIEVHADMLRVMG